jgi:hypothetical protein
MVEVAVTTGEQDDYVEYSKAKRRSVIVTEDVKRRAGATLEI